MARPKGSKNGVTKADKEQQKAVLIAAANLVQKEIEAAINEHKIAARVSWPREFVITGSMTAHNIATKTEAGWRQIGYKADHKFLWQGDTRVSAKGEILLVLSPDKNSELKARKASFAEVGSDLMGQHFGEAANEFIEDLLGDSISSMIEQSMSIVEPDQINAAIKMKIDDPVVSHDTSKMKQFGEWA